jgi:hypothetical protein
MAMRDLNQYVFKDKSDDRANAMKILKIHDKRKHALKA